MLVFSSEAKRSKAELDLARDFLSRCTLVAMMSKSERVYRVVALAPAQHGYPPQVTIETPSGLPLVVDVPLPKELRLDDAA